MNKIIATLLLLIATCAHAVPPIINIGSDSYVVNPKSLFDGGKTYIPSSVSTATYAINAGTLNGLTDAQIQGKALNGYFYFTPTTYFFFDGNSTVSLLINGTLSDSWSVVPTGNYLTVDGYRLTVDGYILTY